MRENELGLMEELRVLSGAEPQNASPEVEQRLVAAFRAHSAQRRRAKWGAAAGALGAIAAAMALLLWASSPKPAQKAIHTVQRAEPSIEEAMTQPVSSAPQARFAVIRTDDVASSFYALPEAADLPAIETAMVVRVEMPALSLQMLGVPLGDDQGEDPVEADVLLGQDGLARGVRLIQ